MRYLVTMEPVEEAILRGAPQQEYALDGQRSVFYLQVQEKPCKGIGAGKGA